MVNGNLLKYSKGHRALYLKIFYDFLYNIRLYVKIIFFLVILFKCGCLHCLAQTDTLNNVNNKSRKQGYWTVYLDSTLHLSIPEKAVYIGFDFYDNGENITKIGVNKKKSVSVISKNKVKTEGLSGNILSGKFSIHDLQNNTIIDANFINGYPTLFISYRVNSNCQDSIIEIADYTKRYNNQPGTFYYELRFCHSKDIQKYWFRKIKNKWKMMPIS